MGSVRRPSDADLAALAGRLRVLARAQLVAAGLTKEAIEYRVEQGRLQHLWRGIYLVGPGPADGLSLARAGELSCAGAAYVGHGWATFVHGFAPAPELPVDVLVVSGSRRGRPDKVRTHRSRLIEPRDLGTLDGIRVTSAARAILDSADRLTPTQLEALIADAQVARAVTEAELHDVADRAGRRSAAAKLRAVFAEAAGITLSEAERILRRLLKEAGLSQPIANHAIGRYRADFAWPAHRLIVELDSWAHHGHRKAFHHDRRRNAWLTAQGWSVLPVTADQLRNEPLAVVARVAEALARREAA